MGFNNVSAINSAGADTTVIGALRSWETSFWPAIRPIVEAKKSVLLLETEPWLVRSISVHQPLGFMAVVELVRGPVMIPALAEDENVVASTERIWVDGYWTEVDI